MKTGMEKQPLLSPFVELPKTMTQADDAPC